MGTRRSTESSGDGGREVQLLRGGPSLRKKREVSVGREEGEERRNSLVKVEIFLVIKGGQSLPDVEMTHRLRPERLQKTKSSEPSRRRSMSDDAEDVERDVGFPSDDEIEERVNPEDDDEKRGFEW